MDAATKAGLLDLPEDAVDAGWRVRRACHELELGEVRAHPGWPAGPAGSWSTSAPAGPPLHGLLAEEAEAILALLSVSGFISNRPATVLIASYSGA